MAQRSLNGAAPTLPSPEEGGTVSLPYLAADGADLHRVDPFVLVAKTALELCRWLVAEAPGLQWIQVENLLDEPEVWATAARKGNDAALDVVVADPAKQYAAIYRLVDVRNVRPVRVTIPVVPGFLKSLRLAISVQLPVRLIPGQPGSEVIDELKESLAFYLHDSMVETPVEFFHSALGFSRGLAAPDLWVATEMEPDVFALPGVPVPAEPGTVDRRLEALENTGAECATCAWKPFCRGFFKVPDPNYSCAGIVDLLGRIGEVAQEMNGELAAFDAVNENTKSRRTPAGV